MPGRNMTQVMQKRTKTSQDVHLFPLVHVGPAIVFLSPFGEQVVLDTVQLGTLVPNNMQQVFSRLQRTQGMGETSVDGPRIYQMGVAQLPDTPQPLERAGVDYCDLQLV